MSSTGTATTAAPVDVHADVKQSSTATASLVAVKEADESLPAVSMFADDHYHVNFGWEEDAKIAHYFKEHGYVIVRDVLSPQECKATRDEVEAAIRVKHPPFCMMDANTHGDMTTVFNNYGMWGGPMLTPQMLRNRQNERLYYVFSALYGGEKKLLINHDSGCFYRATRPVLTDAKTQTTAVCVAPERATAYVYPGLHVDFHPAGFMDEKSVIAKRNSMRYATDSEWMLENNLLVQSDGPQFAGVLNLFPNREEDGGFHCADGFIHSVEAWMQEQIKRGKWKSDASIIGSYEFSNKDKVDMKHLTPLELVRASAPEGALILWNQLTAHGSRPNESDRFRCAQFVKVFKTSTFTKERLEARKKVLAARFEKLKFQPTAIGRTLFGLQ